MWSHREKGKPMDNKICKNCGSYGGNVGCDVCGPPIRERIAQERLARTTCSGSSGMLTDVETELWRMQVRVKDAGAEDAAKVLELAARIVGMSGKQAVALKAAQDLLMKIEAGSCDHPGYEAGTWLRIYGQNVQGMARRDGRPPCEDGLSPSPSPSCSHSSELP